MAASGWRLRELFADKETYELRKLIAADKLFIDRGPVYPVTMTITMAMLEGIPVVRDVYGLVGGNYNDDWKEVEFTPSAYGAHAREAPQ